MSALGMQSLPTIFPPMMVPVVHLLLAVLDAGPILGGVIRARRKVWVSERRLLEETSRIQQNQFMDRPAVGDSTALFLADFRWFWCISTSRKTE